MESGREWNKKMVFLAFLVNFRYKKTADNRIAVLQRFITLTGELYVFSVWCQTCCIWLGFYRYFQLYVSIS